MSRRLLVVLAVVTLVLATFVAPAMAAPPNAQDLALGQAEAGPEPDGHLNLFLPPVQLNGGCESGGAGGCPL